MIKIKRAYESLPKRTDIGFLSMDCGPEESQRIMLKSIFG
ncbi:hypothetical protein DYY67_2206 [Candidatus Nitrosotalea sp. TS]|nr:hypothetical protein [Candidatus Nitrosotalea sp. TS]